MTFGTMQFKQPKDPAPHKYRTKLGTETVLFFSNVRGDRRWGNYDRHMPIHFRRVDVLALVRVGKIAFTYSTGPVLIFPPK